MAIFIIGMITIWRRQQKFLGSLHSSYTRSAVRDAAHAQGTLTHLRYCSALTFFIQSTTWPFSDSWMAICIIAVVGGVGGVDPLFKAPDPARVAGACVTFEPGACTAWHMHPLGQTLVVTYGCGWAQSEGGPIEEIRPGDEESWPAPGDPAALAQEFAGRDPMVEAIIAQVSTTFRWALHDRQPQPCWTRGRLTLLGDAAHPLLPHVGQGANQAIEDAVALAAVLRHADRASAPQALQLSESLRHERCGHVQRSSRVNGAR